MRAINAGWAPEGQGSGPGAHRRDAEPAPGRPVRPASRLICAILVAAAFGAAVAQDNLLQNPGYEALDAEQQPTNWFCPDYWSGELSSVADPGCVHTGERGVLLRATEKQGKHWGRIHPTTAPVAVGLRYRLSVWARGTGSLKLGVIYYFPERADGTRYEVVWPDTVFALGEQWQEAAYEFAVAAADVSSVATMIEVAGEGAEACIDDTSLAVIRRAEGTIVVTPAYVMVPLDDSAEVSIRVTEGTEPMAGGTVLLVTSAPGAPHQQELALDGTGSTAYPFEAGATEIGLVRLSFVQPDIGEVAPVFVDVVDRETYDSFTSAAERTHIHTLPSHFLFLGDSLTDFHRGYNYVDQVGFWLSKVYEGQVSVKNAGVGGDYIRRVWQRLNGDATVYRPDAYDDLYEPKPARVFIFLGHNDSKLTSGSGFTVSVVPPEEFDDLYRKAIEKIQQDTGAQVTVISSTSSVYEITKPRAEELLATRGAASLFGKPEVLENYNSIAKKVADDLGCTYLDVYEPTRTHADKPNLFMADGVHLNLDGNHLVALELLEHLVE